MSERGDCAHPEYCIQCVEGFVRDALVEERNRITALLQGILDKMDKYIKDDEWDSWSSGMYYAIEVAIEDIKSLDKGETE